MTELTKEWLLRTIAELEEERDSMLGVVNEDAAMALAAMKLALASLEAEPIGFAFADDVDLMRKKIKVGGMLTVRHQGEVALYTAPPAPVSVPAAMEMDDDFDSAFEHGKAVGWNAYRAAMLQGSEPVTTAYKSPDDFICMLTGRAKYLREKGEIKSPELLERAAAALQDEIVNTPPIPNGWKLVPIDPTKDMLRAGQSVVGFWLNTVHCYSKMLAAAPEAPQQEVK
jgi:hypothetical protein